MRLQEAFFARDCTLVAKELVGKILVHNTGERLIKLRITETEAYLGETDSACHAYKGKTKRNSMLWEKPGTVYIYLCYGIHWLLNAITGEKGTPQGVLIRACEGEYNGPGKLTKKLELNKNLNGDNFAWSDIIWIEDDGYRPEIILDKRVGIGYANQKDQDALLRYIDKSSVK